MRFDETTQKNVDSWLNGKYDQKSKDELLKLIKENPNQVIDSFYTRMAFGTGGLRGIMGVGTNRMNQYTVGAATQGLANYINMQKKSTPHSVIIGHDSRHNSRYFTEISARVLAANNIKVYVYKELRPVALVSYGCRYKNCTAGIMITASHNPPEYNGYKVYWSDGAQVLPPHDQGIIEEVYNIENADQVQMTPSLSSSMIEWIDDEIDQAYLKEVHKLSLYPDKNKKNGINLKVVYTSIHGAGITMIPKILPDWGFSSVSLVHAQEKPDGDFPTVERPNPEEEGALKLGMEQLLKEEGDILLGTDPDSDRIGVAVRHQCKAVLLSGNETASLCTYHICEALKNQNKLPKNGAFIKTIVTTELMKAIATSYGVKCFNVLTGFKYIGQLIRQWEEEKSYRYLFGGEESYGYLIGTHARDKDAVVMAALICEVALKAKEENKTLVDLLYEVYRKEGIFREKLASIVYPDTKETKEKIKKMMSHLREDSPKSFAQIPVKSLEDYQHSKKLDFESGEESALTLPKSNVLLYWLDDGTKLVIRPSGTEPKIKIYCGVSDLKEKNIAKGVASLDQKLDLLIKEMKHLLQ